MVEKIEAVLAEKVRPRLGEHGGDIKLIGVKDGVVEVKLTGCCSGCPSAQITLEQLVEATLKEEIPEVKRVAMINEVSDDLIDMAKKILNKKI